MLKFVILDLNNSEADVAATQESINELGVVAKSDYFIEQMIISENFVERINLTLADKKADYLCFLWAGDKMKFNVPFIELEYDYLNIVNPDSLFGNIISRKFIELHDIMIPDKITTYYDKVIWDKILAHVSDSIIKKFDEQIKYIPVQHNFQISIEQMIQSILIQFEDYLGYMKQYCPRADEKELYLNGIYNLYKNIEKYLPVNNKFDSIISMLIEQYLNCKSNTSEFKAIEKLNADAKYTNYSFYEFFVKHC